MSSLQIQTACFSVKINLIIALFVAVLEVNTYRKISSYTYGRTYRFPVMSLMSFFNFQMEY